jgi:hypothetical protein
MTTEQYSWDMSIKQIWEQAAKNPPDVPRYQKLIALAQIKAAHESAAYTKWLTRFTFALVTCAVAQTAIIAYQSLKH